MCYFFQFLLILIQQMHKDYSLPSLHSRQNYSFSLLNRSKTNILSRLGHQERKWFQKRGKSESIMFTSQMLNQLRKYFNDLDADNSGAIGLKQLEEPLITLQFCSSKKQVQTIIEMFDLDGSGEVQFAQFLQIFRKFKLNKYANQKQAQKYQTFMEIFSKKTQKFIGKQKNYQLALSQLRRKKLISELTNGQAIKPQQSRYRKKREIIPNFLKKIQDQWMDTPELNSKILQNRKRNYYRVKLGKDQFGKDQAEKNSSENAKNEINQ